MPKTRDSGTTGESGDIELSVEEETPILEEADEVIPFTYSITAYGADYPVESLVQRIERDDIIVPTFRWEPVDDSEVVGFQRQYVWTKPQADRFIESLLLGLPVPGIFLVKEPSGLLLVLDGHQRLRTLASFYRGIIAERQYQLGSSVQERFRGLGYDDLDTEDRRRLNDSIIHATIIRQDEPTEDQSSIYIIFERLNTGGTNLQPQEIRAALYHGPFVTVLDTLNDYPAWRRLYGNKSKRLKDMEMILRFLGLHFYSHEYRRPMKDFLNRYMAANRQLEQQGESEIHSVFTRTTELILEGIGDKAFKPKRAVNAAVLDSVMVGVASRVVQDELVKRPEQLREAYESLLQQEDFVLATERATSDEENVKTRLEAARAAFSGIQ